MMMMDDDNSSHHVVVKTKLAIVNNGEHADIGDDGIQLSNSHNVNGKGCEGAEDHSSYISYITSI
jgi:hypothetical protein